MKEVTIRELEPGDKVLWGDRKEPLTVTDGEVHTSNDAEAIVVESQQGTTYVLIEQGQNIDPHLKRQVTVSPSHPSGVKSEGAASDLRRADDE